MIISGEVKRTIFESKENNYQIVCFVSRGKEYIITGYFQPLIKDITYEIEGEISSHPKFGEQLNVKNVKKIIDTSYEGIVEYLSSNLFPGVGQKYAEEIYNTLGENCLDLIVEDRSCLDKVKLSKKIKDVIYNSLVQNKSLEELFVKMHDSGLTSKNIMKLYEKHQDLTLNHIYNDPYNLIYELDNFGFKKADSLAIKLGFDLLDTKRIQALIMYTLLTLSDSYGMSYVSNEMLFTEANKISDIPIDNYNKGITTLCLKRRIVNEENKIYLKNIYDAEFELANKIKAINSKSKYKIKNIIEAIDNYQISNNIKFSIDQVDAIKNSLLNKFSVITGGPGTGKTTIIKCIIESFCMLNSYNIVDDKAELDIKLLAPTGKAAKRLREKCMFNAQTIHRSLGYDLDGRFNYHEDNLLPSRLVVIDEVSMIDLTLANNLIKAIHDNAIVVFVGDHNQLPSIACGEVLNDIINSKVVEVSVLNTIYRQQHNSGIVNLAKMINEGNIDSNVFHDNNDLHFIPCSDNDINDFVIRYINKAISLEYDLNEDITVLIPMYKGINGIDKINELVSFTYNKKFDFSFSVNDKTFKQNDKVIQLINSKELQIFNGDIGIIDDKVLVNVDDKDQEKINVLFDNKMVKLFQRDFNNIKLAYATSIHKSQGSEYKVVIIPISRAHSIMLKRKLIYTAVTRAKEKLILVGDYNAFINGVNRLEDKRHSTLSARLNNDINLDLQVINDSNICFDTLGEINMENITPYTFM